jgi:hypothetical protein
LKRARAAAVGCAAVAFATLGVACSFDFDAFEPVPDGGVAPDGSNGGRDTGTPTGDSAMPPADGGMPPADTGGPPVDANCSPQPSCFATAQTCIATCVSTDTSCVQGCSGSQGCKQQCTAREVQCAQRCSGQCVTCTQQGGCVDFTDCVDASRID